MRQIARRPPRELLRILEDRLASLRQRRRFAEIATLIAGGELAAAVAAGMRLVDGGSPAAARAVTRLFLGDAVRAPEAGLLMVRYLRSASLSEEFSARLVRILQSYHPQLVPELLRARGQEIAEPVGMAYDVALSLGEAAWAAGEHAQARHLWRHAAAAARTEDERELAGTVLTAATYPPLRALRQLGPARAHEAAPERLTGEVVIILERGADTTPIGRDPRLADCNLVVYTPSRRGALTSDLGRVVRFGSSLDKLPLHSEPSREIYRVTWPLADEVAGIALSELPPAVRKTLEPYSDILALAIAKPLALLLTRLECIDRCLRDEANADAIVVYCRSKSEFPHMIPYLCRYGVPANLYVGAVGGTFEARQRTIELSAGDGRPPIVEERAAESLNEDDLIAACKIAKEMALRCAATAPPGYAMLASIRQSESYAVTLKMLNNALRTKGQPVLIYDNSGPQDAPLFSLEELGSLATTINTGWLESRAIDLPALRRFFGVLANRMEAAVRSKCVQHRDVDISRLVATSVGRSIQSHGAEFVLMSVFFDELFRCARPSVVYVSPSAHRRLRLIAAAAINKAGAPVLDIQALQVARHPRCLPPKADAITVIDDISREMHADYFGVPEGAIHVTGTPRDDLIRDLTLSTPRDEVLGELGLEPSGRRRILFASQPEPIDNCLSVLRQLCAVSRDKDCDLIVKLHPIEGDARWHTYQRVIDACLVGSRSMINRDMRIHRVLAASDVVVTMFSNVARHALLAGQPVVIANYFGVEFPLRFDHEGGIGAYSEQELYDRVAEAACNPVKLVQENSYLSRNPHLRSGDAVSRIIEIGERLAAAASPPPTARPA